MVYCGLWEVVQTARLDHSRCAKSTNNAMAGRKKNLVQFILRHGSYLRQFSPSIMCGPIATCALCRHTEFHIRGAGRNDFSPPTNLAAETLVSESYNVVSRTRETVRSALLCSSRSTCLLVPLITGSGTMAMTLAAAFGVRSSRAAQGPAAAAEG